MSRAVIALVLFSMVMWFAFTMLPGCAARPDDARRDLQPSYDNSGVARSLVADPPLIASPSQTAPTGRPWYASRRDDGPRVVAGYQSPTYRSASTYTSDRVHTSSNGRVHDHYNQTTYRSSHTETID